MDDRIEQTISIQAPLDRVWELVTGGWEQELADLQKRAESS
jgi:hypothetical protein